jgi:hypothetical protein
MEAISSSVSFVPGFSSPSNTRSLMASNIGSEIASRMTSMDASGEAAGFLLLLALNARTLRFETNLCSRLRDRGDRGINA